MSSPSPDSSHLPRSLVDAWRAGKPSPAELRRGYSRYVRRAAPKHGLLRFSRWLLGGLVLGAGVAQAASALPWPRWMAKEVHADAPKARASVAPGASLAPGVGPLEARAAQIEEAEARVEPRSAPSAVKQAPVAVAEPSAGAPSSRAFAVQEQWRLAAEGLRTGNSSMAERALLELERTTRGGERDAAQLARAQLLSSHGRRGEALTLAQGLESSAASSLVRHKARDLRLLLTKNVEAERSTEGGAGIKQP
jgi:hypothetical protein